MQVGDVADGVAVAVARQAVAEGLADQLDEQQILEAVESSKWTPTYEIVSQAGESAQ
jgi:malic enzyme